MAVATDRFPPRLQNPSAHKKCGELNGAMFSSPQEVADLIVGQVEKAS